MFQECDGKMRRFSRIELEIERNLTCKHYFVYCSDAPQFHKAYNETMVNAIFAACKWCGITLKEFTEQDERNLK